jgi:hypothetical protein
MSIFHVQPHTYSISAERSQRPRPFFGKIRTSKKDLSSKTRYLLKFIQLFYNRYDVTKHVFQSGDGIEVIALKELVFRHETRCFQLYQFYTVH